jgi:replication-associated recombination protein RarA
MKTEITLAILGAVAVGTYIYFQKDKVINQPEVGFVETKTTTGETAIVPQATTTTNNNTYYAYTTTTQPNGTTPKVAIPAYTGSASYDTVSGVGYNSAGFGYSSNKDLGSKGTGTGISKVQTIVNPKTGSTVTRTANSIFAGKGFN